MVDKHIIFFSCFGCMCISSMFYIYKRRSYFKTCFFLNIFKCTYGWKGLNEILKNFGKKRHSVGYCKCESLSPLKLLIPSGCQAAKIIQDLVSIVRTAVVLRIPSGTAIKILLPRSDEMPISHYKARPSHPPPPNVDSDNVLKRIPLSGKWKKSGLKIFCGPLAFLTDCEFNIF